MPRAGGAHEKERIVEATCKLKAVVHVVIFPVGGVAAKNAWHLGESGVFKRPMERKRAEPNGQRSDRSEQSEVHGSFSLRWGVQKVVFLMKKCDGLIFKNVLPAEGRKHFLKKI